MVIGTGDMHDASMRPRSRSAAMNDSGPPTTTLNPAPSVVEIRLIDEPSTAGIHHGDQHVGGVRVGGHVIRRNGDGRAGNLCRPVRTNLLHHG